MRGAEPRHCVPPLLPSVRSGTSVPLSLDRCRAVALAGTAGGPAAALLPATALNPPAEACVARSLSSVWAPAPPAAPHPFAWSTTLISLRGGPGFSLVPCLTCARPSPISSTVPPACRRAALSRISSLASSVRPSPDSISPTSPECIFTDFHEARIA